MTGHNIINCIRKNLLSLWKALSYVRHCHSDGIDEIRDHSLYVKFWGNASHFRPPAHCSICSSWDFFVQCVHSDAGWQRQSSDRRMSEVRIVFWRVSTYWISAVYIPMAVYYRSEVFENLKDCTATLYELASCKGHDGPIKIAHSTLVSWATCSEMMRRLCTAFRFRCLELCLPRETSLEFGVSVFSNHLSCEFGFSKSLPACIYFPP